MGALSQPIPPPSSSSPAAGGSPGEGAERPPIPESVRVVELDGRTIYLLGTAHVSANSVEEVRRLVEAVEPDVVAVELDPARLEALTGHRRWRDLDIFQVIKQGKALYLLASIALSTYQRRLGAKLGIRPGAELLAAVEAGEAAGARVELIDRDVHITLKRTWRNLGFWDRARLLAALMHMLGGAGDVSEEDIEELKRRATLDEAMREFAAHFPRVAEPLIYERDRWMAARLQALSARRVVAVVGAAHVDGIVRHLREPVDTEPLGVVPPPGPVGQALKWLVPMLVVAAFGVGWVKHSGESVDEMLKAWFLPNAVFCALLTAMAGARPLSVVVGAIASPFTSLNPLLPAGVVVGLVEAWLRKPTVADAERLGEDVHSLRGLWRNPFTRTLWVAAMATVGSAMGAWVGLGWLWKLAT